MYDIDFFVLYRRLLLIVAGTYTAVRLLQFIWRWRSDSLIAARPEALMRRWVEVSVLRLRLRWFSFDVLQIVLLTAILLYVLWPQIR